MELHILLAGVEFGPYTDDQARELLGEGFLNATDPAKRLDETDWLPLNEVLAQPRGSATPPQPEPMTEARPAAEESAPATTSAPEEESAEEPPVFEWPVAEMPEENVAPKAAAPSVAEEPQPAEWIAPASSSPEFFSGSAHPEEPAPASSQPTGTSRKISGPTKPSASSRVRRELTEAEKTSFLRHLTKALPPAPAESAPAASTSAPPKAPQLTPEKAQPTTKAPPTIRSASAPPTPTSGVYLTSPILTTGPLGQSVTAKAKKARTGALLAQESLRAAREQRGILTPTGTSGLEPVTAPVQRIKSPTLPAPAESTSKAGPTPTQPAETTGPAPTKKIPVVLRGREETQPLPASQPAPSVPAARASSAPPMATPSGASQTTPIPPSNPATIQRKAIKLTGRITLPGLAPKPELPQSKAPSLSGPLVVSRPARTGVTSRIQSTRPVAAPEKSAGLIGEIARPADVARQELAEGIAKVSTPPPLPVEEKKIEETPAPAPEEATASALVLAAGEEMVAEEPATIAPSAGSVAALLQAAGSEAVAETETGTLPPIDEPPTQEDQSASGRLLSSGELADRRSLKITGSLKHPTPRLPIRLSSPSKPGESSRLPFTPADRIPSPALPAPEVPIEPPPLPPAPEESLPPRSETGKIPVSAMPTEGIRIRTRRITGKVPVPEKERAAEPLSARATPPRPLPEAPMETPTSIEKPKALSVTPPRAAEGTTLPEEAPALSGRAPAAEPEASATAPAAPVEAVELRDAPASPTDAPATLPPDKVRLRRPVKLELSSRSKAQETGRLSLEAFSKMASLDLPSKTAPEAETPGVATAAPQVTQAPVAEPGPVSPPEPTATPAPTVFDPPKLEEAPPLVWKSAPKPTVWRLEWLFYGIITIGVVAVCAIVYIVLHRSHSTEEAAAAPVATNTAPAVTNEEPVAPPSAAPPPTSNVAPPASAPAPAAAPPTAVAPAPSPAPTPASTTATNSNLTPAGAAALTASIQDLNRQVEAYVGDGILKYQHGDLVGALAADNEALNLNPKSAAALYNRGIVKAAQGDLDGAVADYSAALQVDPKMGQAYYYRGQARQSKGELDGALSDYNQAVQIDSNNAVAFYDRGMIRMQKDDIDGAIVDSTRALELDPGLIQSYYDRGLGRIAKGALGGALDDMKTFCQLTPQDPFTDYARLYLWVIQSEQGQTATANQDLAKAMNSGWNGAADSLVTRIGEYLLGQISENELLKASTSAIPLKDQGQHCEAWYFIGMRQLQAGDKKAAIEALQKCIDTQKTDYCEYILAQEQLKTLSPGDETPTTPTPPRAQAVTLPDPGTMTTTPADAAPTEK